MFKSSNMQGIILILSSALLYSTMPIFGKLAYATGLGPSNILLLRFSFAFIILLIYVGLIHKKPVLIKSPLVIVQGIVLIVGGLFYFHSLQYLSAGLVTVIFFSHPVIVALLAIPIFKEKCMPRLFWGIFLAILGIGLISGIGTTLDSVSYHGLTLAIIASLCYAAFSLLGQKNIQNASPYTMTGTFSFIGIIILSSFYYKELGFLLNLNIKQVAIGLAMALFNTVLSVSLFLRGVKKIGVSKASLISTFEPVFTLILAFIFLGEVMRINEYLGSVLVLASMFLAITAHKKRVKYRV